MTKPLSITELTRFIKEKIETQFSAVFVEGEVTNFKEQTSGHLYFTLKDEGAQLSCVLFKGNAKSLERMPKSGDQVIVKGELSVYAPRGSYQLIIRELKFSGMGDLLLKYHELKKKLYDLGWFGSEHKKALPKIPKVIGVVTSPTGAVIQDIVQILKRRFSGFQLLLNPVKVQGEGAAEEIALAIEQFNKYNLADVLIVGRGGGSLEDLWAFNEERVAGAIFKSKIPIISAVGHETDVSIADFVASVRAPTPSAAAELVVAEKSQLLAQLERIKKNPLMSQSYALLKSRHLQMDEITSSLKKTLSTRLREKMLHLNGLKKQAFVLKPTQKLSQWKNELKMIQKTLQQVIQKRVQLKKELTVKLLSHLRTIDPRNLLKRGYTLLFHEKNEFPEKNGSIIMSAKEVVCHETIKVLFFDGEALGTLNTVKIHE